MPYQTQTYFTPHDDIGVSFDYSFRGHGHPPGVSTGTGNCGSETTKTKEETIPKFPSI